MQSTFQADVQALRRDGWTVTFQEDQGKLYYWAERAGCSGFTREVADVTCQVESIPAADLLAFVQAGVDGSCDNVRERLIGFARYVGGQMEIRLTSLTQVKKLPEDAREELMALREGFRHPQQSARHPG